MTIWAGRILILQGVIHLVTTLAASQQHLSNWLRGDLWFPSFGMGELSTTAGAFWLTLGSFGVPLIVLGGLITRLGRSNHGVPGLVGWALGLWGVAASAVFQPSPFITLLIPAGLIVFGARRGANGSLPQSNSSIDGQAQEA